MSRTMMPPPLDLHQADPDDLEEVLCVLDAAARRLTNQGIEQWPVSFLEDGARRMRQLARHAEQGNVIVATSVGGVPVGTITVTPWADPDFASAWPGGTGDAQYVLRLATGYTARNLFAPYGIHLGRWLLRYAAELAVVRGCRLLRLDCSRTNERLHDYYIANGFTRVGTVVVEGRKSGALFQRELTR